MGVQACRLPCFILQPKGTLAANRHPKATHQWLLMGVQACRLPALKPLKPLKTLKRLKTLTTRHGGPSLPFAMLHPAANRHPKATHQWLLMGVQACRLPALKPLKPLKTLKRLKTLTTRHGGPSLPFAMLHPAANRHPKATHQWLLMGVQACRLPALKPLKTFKTLTTRHGGPSLPFAMLHPASNRHPKATHQWLLMGVQACRLPALKPLKPLKTFKRLKTLTTRHGGPSLPFAMLHPAANRHPKATHQWLLMGVQACRLPALKRLKPLKPLISVSVYWMLFWCILLVRLFLAKTTSYAREARHTIPKIWKQHSMNSHGNPWYQYIRFIVPQSMFTLPRPSKTL